MNIREIIETTINEFLNEKYSKVNLDMITDFYPEYFKDSKNETEVVGWPSKKEQNIRFEVLLNIGFNDGDSILDFGCGLGSLYEYMNKHFNKFKYVGVDINQDFINKCKKKYPKVKFIKINDITDVKYNYDWFIASGVFTVYTPINDMINVIKKAYKQAKYGVAVNFLDDKYAKNSDLVAIRGYNKEELYKLFLNEFKEFHTVELHDDYINDDFTIYIKKKEFFN